MPTDREVAELRERERADPSLSPEEGGDGSAQPRGDMARSALSSGCVAYAFALFLGIAGVVVMVSSQPIAIVLIALAVGIGFWGRAKLKQAEPHVR
jgi:hypothetical protein